MTQIAPAPSSQPPASERPILEVKDLKTYFFLESGVVRAVDGVTFSLARKQTLGLVGESGCGKSITSMSIMRLIQSPPGRIVGGEINLHLKETDEVVDIAKLDPKGSLMREIRGAEIAMIFQEPMTSLNPLRTIGNQIAEAVQIHQRVSKKAAFERAEEMLAKVQMSAPKQRARQYPHQLSGGMRQRAMIALALSCNPSILIADEPTTALDVTVQAQILDLMRELQNDFGSSIILITHNLGVVSQMADHVAVMYLGRIVEFAPTRELFHHPLHPYTEGLLKSVPVLGRKGKQALVPIKGMVPSPTEAIRGCPFAERCPHVMDICRERAPALTEVAPGHLAACWLHSNP
ncbi:MAG: ABC transporter ATP-binding protein [Anaerolineae bacterium]|nr:ABC transporter ATP-binding protein [Candidatus Roseilinea sp.]MDW8450818.1 ABC transporter ATP-binding protein [Anaerolineae bacterium]